MMNAANLARYLAQMEKPVQHTLGLFGIWQESEVMSQSQTRSHILGFCGNNWERFRLNTIPFRWRFAP